MILTSALATSFTFVLLAAAVYAFGSLVREKREDAKKRHPSGRHLRVVR